MHTNEEHPDIPLLEHVKELIAKLDALGITTSSIEDGDGNGGDEAEWEDASDSENNDGDVEME